jgi:hypothetical protein
MLDLCLFLVFLLFYHLHLGFLNSGTRTRYCHNMSSGLGFFFLSNSSHYDDFLYPLLTEFMFGYFITLIRSGEISRNVTTLKSYVS